MSAKDGSESKDENAVTEYESRIGQGVVKITDYYGGMVKFAGGTTRARIHAYLEQCQMDLMHKVPDYDPIKPDETLENLRVVAFLLQQEKTLGAMRGLLM